MAENVLRGLKPHIDFIDTYTGGLNYIHAGFFRLFGENLLALRIPLLLGFGLTSLIIYSICCRIVRPAIAVLLTLLTCCWGPPLYFASMPSWYNLFLAIGSIWCLMHFIDTKRSYWLVIAGLFIGISITIKITGVLGVLGTLLFLLSLELDQRQITPQSENSRNYFFFLCFCLTMILGVVLLVIRERLGINEFLHFIFPISLLCSLVLHREWYFGRGPLSPRFVTLAKSFGLYLVGLCIPILLFLLNYDSLEEVKDVIWSIVVLPRMRVQFASVPFPPWSHFFYLIPFVLILKSCFGSQSSKISTLELIISLLIWFGLQLFQQPLSIVAFEALYHCLPFIIIAWVIRSITLGHKDLNDTHSFLLLSVSIFASLIQYPFSTGLYFCYIAPIVLLALFYILATCPTSYQSTCRYFLLGAIYIILGIFCVYFSSLSSLRILPMAELNYKLHSSRAGILVSERDASLYNRIFTLVREHSPNSKYIYSGPDSPELYFLTHKLNPRRTLYEFFDTNQNRESSILNDLLKKGVDLVVINNQPEFSAQFSSKMLNSLSIQYPNSEKISHFVVRWR